MYVSRVQIANVRNFLGGDLATDLKIPAKPGWYVFAGRNGSGKTTFLRAVGLGISGPNFLGKLMPTAANWIRFHEDEAIVRVSLVAHPEDQFSGKGAKPDKALVGELRWKRPEWDTEPEVSAKPARQSKPTGPWRGPWNENPKGWLVAGYGAVRRLTGHGSAGQRVMDGPTHVRRMVSLFYEEASLAELVEWLKTLNHKALEKESAAVKLQDDVLALLSDGLLPDGATVEGIFSSGLWVKRGVEKIELLELSDGYRMVLGIVVDLLRHMSEAHGQVAIERNGHVVVKNSAVVLIDEVEAHLHMAWQRRIGTWLTSRFPNVQFLVTTHSPFVCQSAAEHGLFRLPAPGEQAAISAVDEETYYRVVNGTLDDAVPSSLFGLESTESDQANKLRQEWSRLEARRLRKGLTAEEDKRHATLRKQLPLPIDPAAE